jgi:ubiquinol-cytochrome c reductase cytochrome c1 subunit
MKNLFIMLGLLLPFAVQASGEDVHLDKAPISATNQASLQRGAKVFVNYCLNCHGASAMRYNRLKDIGLTDEQIKANLLFAGEKVGETMQVGMKSNDAKAWFGAQPPDLSVIARSRTPDWLYTYLRSFYRDDTRPTGWNNTVFPNVGMPHALWELQGEQHLKVAAGKDAPGNAAESHELVLAKPGKMSPAEYDAMVADLVNYLAFMAEPAKVKRLQLGVVVLFALGILFLFALALKKEFWKDVH